MPIDLALKAVLRQKFLAWLRQPLPGPDRAVSAPQLLLQTVRQAECKDGPGPTAYTAELGWIIFPYHLRSQLSFWCWKFDLQAGHTPSLYRARDSYYLSLAGSSIVHAQIEQKRNQILSCCQLALFHCLHQESSSHSQDCSVLGSAGSANKENTLVSLPSQHFQNEL